MSPSSEQNEQEEFIKWVVQNMWDMEMNKLDDTKRELFLSFLEENKDHWFLQECSEQFQKQKDFVDAHAIGHESDEEEEDEEEEDEEDGSGNPHNVGECECKDCLRLLHQFQAEEEEE